MNSVEIKQRQADLSAFMASSLYAERQASLNLDIAANAEQILSLVPDSDLNIACLLQLHGARQNIIQSLHEFEVLRANLDAKLQATLESENKHA